MSNVYKVTKSGLMSPSKNQNPRLNIDFVHPTYIEEVMPQPITFQEVFFGKSQSISLQTHLACARAALNQQDRHIDLRELSYKNLEKLKAPKLQPAVFSLKQHKPFRATNYTPQQVQITLSQLNQRQTKQISPNSLIKKLKSSPLQFKTGRF
uniref:Uncharacterized protein n=1 Tax=Spironucleus salmonicida TaxID=348837 RepID=V6LUD5_9EUKA|eukprot:EST47873.1 Hypothetical protein SS50377_12065 [Spironucleus salmonicida]